MIIRNKDNYVNAYQYIKDQLFKYNYNNVIHYHILKLKLWVLDGDILQGELTNGVSPDTNITNPMNHKDSLENELYFLDLYRKTKENKLEQHEQPFSITVTNRKNMMTNWINLVDPLTGQKRKDYDMAYSMRPLLMTEAQIDELYKLYKVKENAGELSSCLEITTKVVEDININNRAVMAEMAVLNYIMPAETKQKMIEQAFKIKRAEDDDLVNEINSTKQKIINQCIKPAFDGKTNISPVPPEFQTTTDIDVLAVYIPQDRVTVEQSGVRKGHINTYNNTGGYRYLVNPDVLRAWKVAKVTVDYTTSTSTTSNGDGTTSTETTYNWISYSIIPQAYPYGYIDIDTRPRTPTSPSDTDTFVISIPLHNNEVERNWNNFNFIMYSVVTTTSTDPDTGDTSSSTTSTLKSTAFNIFNIARFNELNTRWSNLNIFREHKINDVGLRTQLETLFDTNVPYILDKLKKILADLLEEKIHVTNILKEDCLFGEFI